MTDSILGAQSNTIDKKSVKLKYDHSDEGSDVTPLHQVDYSKSKIDINKLMEPLQNVDLEDVNKVNAAAKNKKADSTPVTELTV